MSNVEEEEEEEVRAKQHAKWTAKRIRRGLFGQSLVDFSTASWSSIQLKDSAFSPASQQKREQPKKTPRILRSFAQSRVVAERERECKDTPSFRGMSFDSDDIDMDAGTAEFTGSLSFSTNAVHNQKGPQKFDIFSVASDSEESIDTFS